MGKNCTDTSLIIIKSISLFFGSVSAFVVYFYHKQSCWNFINSDKLFSNILHSPRSGRSRGDGSVWVQYNVSIQCCWYGTCFTTTSIANCISCFDGSLLRGHLYMTIIVISMSYLLYKSWHFCFQFYVWFSQSCCYYN